MNTLTLIFHDHPFVEFHQFSRVWSCKDLDDINVHITKNKTETYFVNAPESSRTSATRYSRTAAMYTPAPTPTWRAYLDYIRIMQTIKHYKWPGIPEQRLCPLYNVYCIKFNEMYKCTVYYTVHNRLSDITAYYIFSLSFIHTVKNKTNIYPEQKHVKGIYRDFVKKKEQYNFIFNKPSPLEFMKSSGHWKSYTTPLRFRNLSLLN